MDSDKSTRAPVFMVFPRIKNITHQNAGVAFCGGQSYPGGSGSAGIPIFCAIGGRGMDGGGLYHVPVRVRDRLAPRTRVIDVSGGLSGEIVEEAAPSKGSGMGDQGVVCV